jgi:lysophospholipase L1-like esterase
MLTRQIMRFVALVSFPVLLLAVNTPASAQSPKRPQWVGTWAASPMLAEGGFRVHPFAAMTLREIVHISNGGQQLRVRFTNEFGLDPLTVGNAHVALSAGAADIQDGTDHTLTFGGATVGRIPPGAVLYSDPVPFVVAPLADVAVSFYLPSQVMRTETLHISANQDNYTAPGDVCASKTLSQPVDLQSWYFLDGIDVPAVEGARAIVTLGDSITDGSHSTISANRRWPDVLAARLKQDPSLNQVSVLNEGIGGNRVVNDATGPSALARLDRDVLSQNGVRYVIVLESINDIGRFSRFQGPEDDITTEQLIQGLKQIADVAHEHGIKAIGATLTPYGGAGYYSDKGEKTREDINNWIRQSGTFDGVIDFDRATGDPQNPTHFNPLYDSGDHLHPNDAGYKAMGESIDLSLFKQ